MMCAVLASPAARAAVCCLSLSSSKGRCAPGTNASFLQYVYSAANASTVQYEYCTSNRRAPYE